VIAAPHHDDGHVNMSMAPALRARSACAFLDGAMAKTHHAK